MDSAPGNAPAEFSEAWTTIRDSTGLDPSVKCLLGASLHGAKTDSINVEFSESFMDKCIVENYHGFTDSSIASSGTAFVIGHEVGHLTVHPGKFSDWNEEAKSYPCSPGQQGMWSNVLSDIIVNYHVTRCYNFSGGKPADVSTLSPQQQKMVKALAQGRRWEILNRECGAGGRASNLVRHADLLASGALTDNRFNGGKYTNHEPGNEYEPTRATPIYETRQGHGRGVQYYPPISYACAKSLPEKYRKVRATDTVNSFICGTTNKSFSWQDTGSTSPWGGSISSSGPSLSPGDYTVQEARSYDGKSNYSEPWPAYEYKINGNWYPAQYFVDLCPDCGEPATGSWMRAFKPNTQPKPVADHNFLYRMLLIQEFAANYAEDGFGGNTGQQAVDDWFSIVGWALHVAYMEQPPFEVKYMAYDDHPLYSDKGIRILKDIYAGLYKIEKDDATGTYEIGSDLQTNVVHFNNNKVGIVYNLRRFLTSTTRIALPDTVDSGIYMCDPMNGGCGRRSFMYDWEFVDFGVYGNLANWLGNVSLDVQKIKNTLGIQVMCRVKCNHFTQCNECHQTSAGHRSNCIYCGSSNLTTGGCGKESWTAHTVQERTAENIIAQERSDIIPTQLYEIMSGSGKLKAPEVSTTGIFAFRITYNGPATGQVNNYLDAVNHIPNMEIGYQIGAYRKPYGFTCDTCGDERYFPPPTAAHPFGAPMESSNIDTNYTANQTSPQTGGIYQGIGKDANSNQCLKCSGTYQPNMGWEVGRPKVCGPLDAYTDEYNRHYREQQFARTHNALPTKYPLSTMKWAFTMDPLIRCGAHGNRNSSYGYSDPMLWTDRAMARCYSCGQFNMYGTNCNNCDRNGLIQGTDYDMEIFPANTKLQFCPLCGPENTPYDQLYTDEFTSGKPYIFPREKLVIVNPQPFLTNTVDQMLTMGGNATSIGGRGAYLININSVSSNDYRYQMYLPIIYSTDLVPETMDDIHTNAPSGAGSEPCPHDFMHQPPPPTPHPAGTPAPASGPPAQGCCSIGTTQVLADETTCLSMGGTYAGDGTTCVNPTTQAVVSGNRIADPCAGVTMEGLSFLIAEGRATSAFKNRAGVYIDASPDCRSYRDPGSPSATGGPLITYPRFTQVIGDDPRSTTQGGTVTAGARYLFCDPNGANTGIICDPYHKSALATVTAGMSGQLGVTTHTLRQVGIREDPNYGFIEEVNCETCSAIAREGEQLAKRNDPLGRGTPFPKVDPSDWTTCGGAATLREAWEASPQLYHPGMGVLLYRSRLGQIQVNGWKDDFTPDCSFPKQSQYVETCLQGELALEANGFIASPTGMENIPCPGGWWNWALHSGGCTSGSPSQPCESWRIRSARGDTIVL